MKCPACGGAELEPNRRRLMPYEWHGHETMLECEGAYCPLCGEMVLNDENAQKLDEQIKIFQSQAASGLKHVSLGDWMAQVRKKLGLSQKEAGEIFGGGAQAFRQYEHGQIKPSRAILALLHVLENNPQLLDEARAGSKRAEQASAPDAEG